MDRSKLDFVGFGALNMDILYRFRPGRRLEQAVPDLRPGGERIGSESEREQILGSIQEQAMFVSRSGGGQAANTTIALTCMGFRCGFLGKVGDDEMGDFLLESLNGVDKSHVQRGGNSGLCLCMLNRDGERANVVFPGCNDTIVLHNSDADYIRDSRALHLTSFCSKRMIGLQRWLLQQNLGDIIVTFDPGEIYSRLGLRNVRKILEFARVLFATKEELQLITGKEPRKAAEDIIRCGTDIVVCKQAEQGSDITFEGGTITIPAVHVEKVVDKTGAGDVYAAGFIAGLLLDLSLELCGRLASEAAALSISAYGRGKYPDKQFLQTFLNSNLS